MGKAKITHRQDDEKRRKNNVIISLVIVLIMGFSAVGYVFISGGAPASQQNGQMTDFPLTEGAFRDTAGNTYWGAVKNNEQFVYLSVEGYDERTDIEQIAQRLENQRVVELFVGDNITDSNAIFTLEKKISNAFEISFVRVENSTCDKDSKLILTSRENITGNCMILKTNDLTAEEDVMILSYHMLK